MLFPLCLSLLVRLGGYIVNLCVFYSYRLIGKLNTLPPPNTISFLVYYETINREIYKNINMSVGVMKDEVVVQIFIGTQNRLVSLHSVLIKTHEETDIIPLSVIYRPSRIDKTVF
jgi:hypothetical protein